MLIKISEEVKNALIVASKSGVKVKIIFCADKENNSKRNLSRSYFYNLIKEGVEVYEYKGSKMTSKIILIDNDTALISSNNIDCLTKYKNFNAGVYMYGESVILVYNDIREILLSSQMITIKDMQKRKLSEKINATWNRFLTLFR